MKIKYFWLNLIILVFLIFSINCKSQSDIERIIDSYTIIPKENIIIYDFNINEIMNLKFADIEKKLGYKTQVDSEVAVAFIDIDHDFIVKMTSVNNF